MATAFLAFMVSAFVFVAACKESRKECYANTHDQYKIHQTIPPVKSIVLNPVYLIVNQIEMTAIKDCDKDSNSFDLMG